LNFSGSGQQVFVSIGSNEGDRRVLIKEAVVAVGQLAGTTIKSVSSIYLSEPVGADGQRWFLNCVLKIETHLEPIELLDGLELIEASMGRIFKGSNVPRTIDLDIILFGDLISHDERLTIPHPRMRFRRFVLEPLLEVAPDTVHPALGARIADLLSAVSAQDVVRAEPFAPRVSYRHIAVEGPIGVGKSSLAEKLAEYFGAKPVFEMSVENPFLADFYENPRKLAFSTQLFFLLSRLGISREAEREGHSMIVSDYLLEKDLLFSRLNLAGEELRLYNVVREQLGPGPGGPDLVIFLSADAETLFKRTRKRGRSSETGITEEYIAVVGQAYRDWFSKYDGGAALMINANDADLSKDEMAFGKLLWKISHPIKGRETFESSDG
jgi:2-amino-4-hydroxy-6-hydroxymethyldihydropteridine diphosphokinase